MCILWQKPRCVRDLATTRRRSVYICEACVNVCRSILAKTTVTAPGTYKISSSNLNGPAPRCCSFCDKPQHIVDKLIGSPPGRTPAYICDKCVAASLETIRNDAAESGPPRNLWHWVARKVGIHSSYIQ
ncbi:MAG TPA: ClpX C4-type zinc finger protein [Candidatus Angelobacter sp.]